MPNPFVTLSEPKSSKSLDYTRFFIPLLLTLGFSLYHIYLVRNNSLFYIYGDDNESWLANIWTIYKDGLDAYFRYMRNRLSLHTFLSLPLTFLTGDAVIAGRILTLLSSALTVFLFSYFMWMWAGPIPSLLATVLLASLPQFHLITLNFTPQSLLLLFQFLLLFTGLREIAIPRSRRFFLSGLATGAGLWINDQFIFYIPIFLLALPFIKESQVSGRAIGPFFSLKRIRWYLAGTLIVAVPYLVVGSLFFTRLSNMKLTHIIREHYIYLLRGKDVQFFNKVRYIEGGSIEKNMMMGQDRTHLHGIGSRIAHLYIFSVQRLNHFFRQRDTKPILFAGAAILLLLPLLIYSFLLQERKGELIFLLVNLFPILIFLFTYWEKRHIDFFIPIIFVLTTFSIDSLIRIFGGRPLGTAISIVIVALLTSILSYLSLSILKWEFRDTEVNQNPKFYLMEEVGRWLRTNTPEEGEICSTVPYYSVFGRRRENQSCHLSLIEGRFEEALVRIAETNGFMVIDNLSPDFDFSSILSRNEPQEGWTWRFRTCSHDRTKKVAVISPAIY